VLLQAIIKVTYATTYDPDFSMMLRERRYVNLDQMKGDVVDILGNMDSLGKIRINNTNTNKKKQKEDLPTQASSSNSQYVKMKEMAKLIRTLSIKITRIEMGNRVIGLDPKNVGQRSPQPNPSQ